MAGSWTCTGRAGADPARPNVYLFAIRSEEGAKFLERRFMPLVFKSYLSSVVAEELYAEELYAGALYAGALYAGALDVEAVRLIERYVGALERTGRLVTPIFADWKEAGSRSPESPTASRGGRLRFSRC